MNRNKGVTGPQGFRAAGIAAGIKESGALDLTVTGASVAAAVETPTTVDVPTAAAPSGKPMPVGDLPGWKQVFSDDFTALLRIRRFSFVRMRFSLDLMFATREASVS